ncbi:hypothetical protein FOA43_000664 [Brettanomyces nanus]|uniref:Patatin-like phospholipase domain-containing protein n=1 Tax=Eeniella nana TaxID=13502 RepID=A0A875S1U5_EENNA|nr:uncharacterized protein FOA43_000664 [Brettanomyces nanus]QPG73354.1 hypothetical protein FOA43_000664 [Brettanomyces nanus]
MGEDPSSLDAEFINEDDLEAFGDALAYDDMDSPSMNAEDTSSVYHLSRVPTITSQSDWKPVYNLTKSPNTSSSPHTRKRQVLPEESSLTFSILHYPLLVITLLWLIVLSFGYLLVRLSIFVSEKLIFFRDKKGSELVKDLENAHSYAEYVATAKQLDEYLDLNSWCHEDKYRYYDWRTLRRTVSDMKKLRGERKYDKLLVVLQSCLKSNFVGIENPIMYSHCYYGTKDLIERYKTEVVASINAILTTDKISLSDKHTFFKIVSRNYGKTALALSGGASFCYNHFGVIKALLENDLLPQIISGTSGGGAIAGLVGTRTNEELLKLIQPKLAHRMTLIGNDPFRVWFKRWWKTGARFDAVQWARIAQWWTMGSTTFKELHERTGKMLNISTVPNDIHSPTILCNEITSPNCCIWSSILASAAVPGILQPVVLMQKASDLKTIEPFSFGNKWRDGSMRTDIPLEALNAYYNVKFSVVSQVNPHVMLWIFKNRGDIGKPIVRKSGKTFRGGFIPAYLENLIKLEIIKWLKLIREFQLFPNLAESDWSNLFLQRFGGNITLFPKIRLTDYMYLLSDPTEERLGETIKNGEHVTYPTLLFIKNRLSIERAIAKGRNVTKGYGRQASPDEHEEEIEYQSRVNRYDGDQEDTSIYSDDLDSFYDEDEDEEVGNAEETAYKRSFLGIQEEPAVLGFDRDGEINDKGEGDTRKTK